MLLKIGQKEHSIPMPVMNERVYILLARNIYSSIIITSIIYYDNEGILKQTDTYFTGRLTPPGPMTLTPGTSSPAPFVTITKSASS